MRSIKLQLVFCFSLISTFARADYAWIPSYHHLSVKAGGDYFTSGDNYDNNGNLTPLSTGGQLSTLKEYKFLVETEYGFADRWSGFFRLPLVSTGVDSSSASILSGSGASDLGLGIKWQLMDRKPILTLELTSKLPLYSTSAPASDEVVLGDGTFDLGAQLHLGYRLGSHFAVGLSPGFVLRNSGFENAFTLVGFAGTSWNPVYVRLVSESYFSLNKTTSPTVISLNPAVGSGGSFARLSKNQDLVTLGGRLGFFLSKQYKIETSAMWSIMGNQTAHFFRGGLNFVADFDLYRPEPPKIKVKEIPFETEQQPAEKPSSEDFGSPTENSQ